MILKCKSKYSKIKSVDLVEATDNRISTFFNIVSGGKKELIPDDLKKELTLDDWDKIKNTT